MSVERLTEVVRTYQYRTGEETLLVALHDEAETVTGIYEVGYEHGVGLLVDGLPASERFFWQLDGFKALQQPPSVLH